MTKTEMVSSWGISWKSPGTALWLICFGVYFLFMSISPVLLPGVMINYVAGSDAPIVTKVLFGSSGAFVWLAFFILPLLVVRMMPKYELFSEDDKNAIRRVSSADATVFLVWIIFLSGIGKLFAVRLEKWIGIEISNMYFVILVFSVYALLDYVVFVLKSHRRS